MEEKTGKEWVGGLKPRRRRPGVSQRKVTPVFFFKCCMRLLSPQLGFEPKWYISGFSLSKSPDKMRWDGVRWDEMRRANQQNAVMCLINRPRTVGGEIIRRGGGGGKGGTQASPYACSFVCTGIWSRDKLNQSAKKKIKKKCGKEGKQQAKKGWQPSMR